MFWQRLNQQDTESTTQSASLTLGPVYIYRYIHTLSELWIHKTPYTHKHTSVYRTSRYDKQMPYFLKIYNFNQWKLISIWKKWLIASLCKKKIIIKFMPFWQNENSKFGYEKLIRLNKLFTCFVNRGVRYTHIFIYT